MFKKLLFTAALLATFANASAQSTAPFGVTGSITPAPCNVTLSAGVVTLGTPTQATVKSYITTNNASYVAPFLTAPISITCGAATKFALSFADNRAGKITGLDFNDPVRFGLVDGSGTTAIGSYQVSLVNAVVDTASTPIGQFLGAANGTVAWSTVPPAPLSVSINTAIPGRSIAFAKTAGATTPDAITTLSANLSFTVFLNIAYLNSVGTAVTPNGSGTLTLVYL